jgi:NhaA family Na+:H+ antiporter
MRPFLLTLAIVDDIVAIVVIAVVYTPTVHWAALGLAAGIVAAIVVLRRSGVRMPAAFVALGGGLWLAIDESGVHATIAGVVLGLLTPSIPLRPGAASPLARLESLLHPWTSFVVVPLFALANAGIPLSGAALRDAATSPIALGVLLGLVLGKAVGITGATWLATRAGIGRLPAGIRWSQLASVGMLAGIGFTVSLFVADLAFAPALWLDLSKMGILAASVLAGAAGSLALSRSTRGG